MDIHFRLREIEACKRHDMLVDVVERVRRSSWNACVHLVRDSKVGMKPEAIRHRFVAHVRDAGVEGVGGGEGGRDSARFAAPREMARGTARA